VKIKKVKTVLWKNNFGTNCKQDVKEQGGREYCKGLAQKDNDGQLLCHQYIVYKKILNTGVYE
jgi:hypothetical protein